MSDLDRPLTGFPDVAQAGFGPRWVTLSEIYALHERQLLRFGGPSGVRDKGALESALDRARNKWEYQGADLVSLGAAYAYEIVRNHPFIDGNKRAAFVTMMLFLRKKGRGLRRRRRRQRSSFWHWLRAKHPKIALRAGSATAPGPYNDHIVLA